MNNGFFSKLKIVDFTGELGPYGDGHFDVVISQALDGDEEVQGTFRDWE